MSEEAFSIVRGSVPDVAARLSTATDCHYIPEVFNVKGSAPVPEQQWSHDARACGVLNAARPLARAALVFLSPARYSQWFYEASRDDLFVCVQHPSGQTDQLSYGPSFSFTNWVVSCAPVYFLTAVGGDVRSPSTYSGYCRPPSHPAFMSRMDTLIAVSPVQYSSTPRENSGP